jgi:hypothetical protein
MNTPDKLYTTPKSKTKHVSNLSNKITLYACVTYLAIVAAEILINHWNLTTVLIALMGVTFALIINQQTKRINELAALESSIDFTRDSYINEIAARINYPVNLDNKDRANKAEPLPTKE